jgi:hypothetical protein
MLKLNIQINKFYLLIILLLCLGDFFLTYFSPQLKTQWFRPSCPSVVRVLHVAGASSRRGGKKARFRLDFICFDFLLVLFMNIIAT